MNDLVKKLEEYKSKRNITNSELAKKLSIPEAYIYRWKKGGMSKAYQRIISQFLSE